MARVQCDFYSGALGTATAASRYGALRSLDLVENSDPAWHAEMANVFDDLATCDTSENVEALGLPLIYAEGPVDQQIQRVLTWLLLPAALDVP